MPVHSKFIAPGDIRSLNGQRSIPDGDFNMEDIDTGAGQDFGVLGDQLMEGMDIASDQRGIPNEGFTARYEAGQSHPPSAQKRVRQLTRNRG